MSEHDFIVVGSGAGGGPLAANLAAAGYTVLLLEAGGSPESFEPEHSFNYDVPAFHPNASEEDAMSWRFFVDHYNDPVQAEKDWKFVPEEKGIFYPRAATLGGCTAHNAMILIYPQNSDWDHIAELTGDRSWRGRAMRRYFKRFEDCHYRPFWRFFHRIFRWDPTRHGFRGWLSTEEADPKILFDDDELLKVVKRSALKQLFSRRNPLVNLLRFVITAGDPNTWWSVWRRSEGMRLVPMTRRDGGRTSARERVLAAREAHPDQLEIRTGALVSRVLFDDDDRAIGVEYLEGAHLYEADPRADQAPEPVVRTASARREVILCGGAFNTPQLLQLSGIGPRDLLEKHGLEVRVDSPGVGRNLQDRYEISLVLRMKKEFSMLAGATMEPPRPGEQPDRQFVEWRDHRSGAYTTNGTAISIIRRSDPKLPVPDLFIFGLVTDFRGYYPSYSARVRASKAEFTWAVLKGHTENTSGTVRIRSKDPRRTPEVDFKYFDPASDPEGRDLEAVVDGLEFIRKITRGYRNLVDRELTPGKEIQSRDQMRQYVRNEAWGHHASCTAKIGADDDPMAVLDGDFRVRGTRGLRVVDASVFPRIPGLFIASAVFMVAEKASDVILRDARRGGRPPKPPLASKPEEASHEQ